LSRYVLDADVTIDWLRGREPSARFLGALLAQGHDVSLTAVTVDEVFAGTLPPDRSDVAQALAQFDLVELTFEMGRQAGEYQFEFARRGQTRSTPDMLNAAAAHALGAALVTRNTRHYPMAGITVVAPS
jgi:predicted nucleic acid-binding protein